MLCITWVLDIGGLAVSITSIKCVLTQEHLDAICAKYFVPRKFNPQLPSSDANMQWIDQTGILECTPDSSIMPTTGFGSDKVSHFEILACQRLANIALIASDENEKAYLSRWQNTIRKPYYQPPFWFVPRRGCRLVWKREFVEMQSAGDGGGKRAIRVNEKRATWKVERLPASFHHPKRLRADLWTYRKGVPALPTLPFFTSSMTASPLEEGRDRTDFVTGPSLRIIGPSARLWDRLPLFVCATQFAIPADVSKDKHAPHPSIFGSSSSSEKTDRTLSLFTGRSRVLCLGSGFDDREEHSLGKRLIGAQKEVVCGSKKSSAHSRAQVSGLEATENSLQGKVASAQDHNVLLEQECNSLKFKVTGLEFTIAEKDHELSELGASSSSLKSQNQSLVNQVHELEISSTDLREKLEMYEGILKQLEEFQDNLIGPLRTRLAEIEANFTRCCMRFQESFHSHLLNVVAERRWLLTHGMKLLVLIFPLRRDDFNSAIVSPALNCPLLQEHSHKERRPKPFGNIRIFSVLDEPWLVGEKGKILSNVSPFERRFGSIVILYPPWFDWNAVEVPASIVLSTVALFLLLSFCFRRKITII
ncbi:hypothetical protein Tco_1352843 [Tanacetum coccineum]